MAKNMVGTDLDLVPELVGMSPKDVVTQINRKVPENRRSVVLLNVLHRWPATLGDQLRHHFTVMSTRTV